MRSITPPTLVLSALCFGACASGPSFAPDELAEVERFQEAVRRELARGDAELFADELLFELPPDWQIETLDVHGRTGTGFSDEGAIVVLFDGTLRGVPWIGSIPIPQTADGEIARLVFQTTDEREALACAGKMLGGFDAIHRFLVRDGVTLIGTRNGTQCVVTPDGVREGSWFDERFAPVLSLDGSQVAYGRSTLFDLSAVIAPIEDLNRTSPLHHEGLLDWPAILLGEGRWTSRVTIGGEAAIWHDDRAIGPFDRIWGPVEWSDNNVLVWAVQRDGRFGYVIDGVPTAMYERATWSELTDDGAHFAFLAHEGGVANLVLDGEVVNTAVGVGAIALAPAGGAWAVAADDPFSDGITVRSGDRTFGPFESVAQVRLDRVGDAVLIGESRVGAGRWWIGDEPLGPMFDSVEDVTLLEDRRGAVFVGRDPAGAYLVTPGSISGPWDWVSGRRISPDGERVAFVAGRGREVWRRVLSIRP